LFYPLRLYYKDICKDTHFPTFYIILLFFGFSFVLFYFSLFICFARVYFFFLFYFSDLLHSIFSCVSLTTPVGRAMAAENDDRYRIERERAPARD
jgi:hypothetical protein